MAEKWPPKWLKKPNGRRLEQGADGTWTCWISGHSFGGAGKTPGEATDAAEKAWDRYVAFVAHVNGKCQHGCEECKDHPDTFDLWNKISREVEAEQGKAAAGP
jgi:hypothetical protein